MRHTFLLKEGIWVAQGKFIDEAGQMIPLKGEMRIKHGRRFWSNDTVILLLREGNSSLQLTRHYTIRPFAAARHYTTWHADDPSIGTLIGKYIIIGNSIISTAVSEDSRYISTEVVTIEDAGIYKYRGFLFKKEERVSTWWGKLKKVA